MGTVPAAKRVHQVAVGARGLQGRLAWRLAPLARTVIVAGLS